MLSQAGGEGVAFSLGELDHIPESPLELAGLDHIPESPLEPVVFGHVASILPFDAGSLKSSYWRKPSQSGNSASCWLFSEAWLAEGSGNQLSRGCSCCRDDAGW